MRKERLHTKPFITAGVLLLVGIILMALGFIRGDDPGMNNYALAAFGLLFLIVAIVTLVMYWAIEKRYRNLLHEEPLLRYTLKAEAHQTQIQKNIDELKSKNKALLFVMLFFCVLFAVILPFFVEEKLTMIAICLGLGAFLTLAAWVITAYRVRKLKRGGEEVILGRGGAYLEGSFHAWDMPETSITNLSYEPSTELGKMGKLTIEYTAQSVPAPLTETIVLLIPDELDNRMPGVIQALGGGRMPQELSSGNKLL